tara:strand:- start:3157 stop:3498 length:342 start_codon:yes stop_codon:yes gene_type:complete
MATRPERIGLIADQQAWDGEVDANFGLAFDTPFPIHTELTLVDLQNNFSASTHDECVALVVGVLYISIGNVWVEYTPIAANVADSTAVTVADMATDFNLLLTALQNAGIMATP